MTLLETLCRLYVCSAMGLQECVLSEDRAQYRWVFVTPVGVLPLTDWVAMERVRGPDA